MKIAIFGATGGTGRQIAEQALQAGHQVVALARDPAKLGLPASPNLTVIPGNVLDATAAAKTVAGADAVFVSLGNTSNNPDMIVSSGTNVIVAAMKEQGVRRLIIISSIGVGDSKDQVPFAFKVLMGTVLRKAMEDKEEQEKVVRASGLDWTIIRPGGLTNNPPTGNYQTGVGLKVKAGQISRADVATFALAQLNDPQYIGKAPSIT
ncbi:MAG: SDR family oxidoreductase [Anaerolineales bacterium]|nr:SDR family oxidoreductase [Anaerolineales bacterium]